MSPSDPAALAVVASADPARRRDWSAELERTGLRVQGCAGPGAACPLTNGLLCPLLVAARIAVYDEESVTPQHFLRLVRTLARPTVVFARDEESAGRHRARYARALDRRSAAGLPHT